MGLYISSFFWLGLLWTRRLIRQGPQGILFLEVHTSLLYQRNETRGGFAMTHSGRRGVFIGAWVLMCLLCAPMGFAEDTVCPQSL